MGFRVCRWTEQGLSFMIVCRLYVGCMIVCALVGVWAFGSMFGWRKFMGGYRFGVCAASL